MPEKYIANPIPGASHPIVIGEAEALNIKNNKDIFEKLSLCLSIGERKGFEKLNIHLEGSGREEVNGLPDKIIKSLDNLGFIRDTPRALKGKIIKPYSWLNIEDFRKNYIPKIKNLDLFGISYGKFVCAHCAPLYDRIRNPIQVGGNSEGLTVLYRGFDKQYVEDMFSVFQ